MALLNSTSISSLAFLVIAIAMWQMSGGLSEMSRIFPRVVAFMLGLFSIIQLVLSMLQRKEETPFANVELKRILITALGMAAYIVAMIYTGFVASSIAFLCFFFWYLSRGKEGKHKLPIGFFLALSVSIGFYSLFHYVFSVPLPVGIFFEG